jgi:hypothetical protein
MLSLDEDLPDDISGWVLTGGIFVWECDLCGNMTSSSHTKNHK